MKCDTAPRLIAKGGYGQRTSGTTSWSGGGGSSSSASGIFNEQLNAASYEELRLAAIKKADPCDVAKALADQITNNTIGTPAPVVSVRESGTFPQLCAVLKRAKIAEEEHSVTDQPPPATVDFVQVFLAQHIVYRCRGEEVPRQQRRGGNSASALIHVRNALEALMSKMDPAEKLNKVKQECDLAVAGIELSGTAKEQKAELCAHYDVSMILATGMQKAAYDLKYKHKETEAFHKMVWVLSDLEYTYADMRCQERAGAYVLEPQHAAFRDDKLSRSIAVHAAAVDALVIGIKAAQEGAIVPTPTEMCGDDDIMLTVASSDGTFDINVPAAGALQGMQAVAARITERLDQKVAASKCEWLPDVGLIRIMFPRPCTLLFGSMKSAQALGFNSLQPSEGSQQQVFMAADRPQRSGIHCAVDALVHACNLLLSGQMQLTWKRLAVPGSGFDRVYHDEMPQAPFVDVPTQRVTITVARPNYQLPDDMHVHRPDQGAAVFVANYLGLTASATAVLAGTRVIALSVTAKDVSTVVNITSDHKLEHGHVAPEEEAAVERMKKIAKYLAHRYMQGYPRNNVKTNKNKHAASTTGTVGRLTEEQTRLFEVAFDSFVRDDVAIPLELRPAIKVKALDICKKKHTGKSAAEFEVAAYQACRTSASSRN